MTNHQSRKASLTMADLEFMVSTNDNNNNNEGSMSIHDLNYEIFVEICQDAEVEDENCRNSNTNHRRRSSITGTTQDDPFGEYHHETALTQTDHHHIRRGRRHSTYNPRNRRAHRDAHMEIKELLSNRKDKNYTKRNSFVNNLMDFNLSYEVSMAASKHELLTSPALNFSCPVLNYLREDDEDSIELQMMKRPSLIFEREQDDEKHLDSLNWESFKDDGESELPQDGHTLCMEYVIELPLMDESKRLVSKDKRKQRQKPHSYKMLERRLSIESPMSVIKSLTRNDEMRASLPTTSSPSPPQPAGKELDTYIGTGIQSPREQLMLPKQQHCARGA